MNDTPPQPTLFDNLDQVEAPPIDSAEIPGLTYLPDFMDQESHDQLLAKVDSQPWLNDLRRDFNFCARHGRWPEWPHAARIRWRQRCGKLAGFRAGDELKREE